MYAPCFPYQTVRWPDSVTSTDLAESCCNCFWKKNAKSIASTATRYDEYLLASLLCECCKSGERSPSLDEISIALWLRENIVRRIHLKKCEFNNKIEQGTKKEIYSHGKNCNKNAKIPFVQQLVFDSLEIKVQNIWRAGEKGVVSHKQWRCSHFSYENFKAFRIGIGGYEGIFILLIKFIEHIIVFRSVAAVDSRQMEIFIFLFSFSHLLFAAAADAGLSWYRPTEKAFEREKRLPISAVCCCYVGMSMLRVRYRKERKKTSTNFFWAQIKIVLSRLFPSLLYESRKL